MKYFLFLLFFLCLQDNLFSQTMNPIQNHEQIGQNLTDIFFIDDTYGWIVGHYGTILNTNDGGKTWYPKQIGNFNLTSVHFTSQNVGWASGWLGDVFKTEDGGNTWVQKVYQLKDGLDYVYFISESTGWIAGGWDGKIHKTIDGGQTWTEQSLGVTGSVQGLYFANSTTGWVCWYDDLLKTIDSGNTWVIQPTGISGFLKGFEFISENVGWVFGGDGQIKKTIDGGNSWTTQSYNDPNGFSFDNMFALTENYVFGMTPRGDIYVSENGGDVWSPTTYFGFAAGMNAYHFFNDTLGMAVGDDGYIYKTNNGGDSWIDISDNVVSIEQNEKHTRNEEFILKGNYPNPFNASTVIRFQVYELSDITIKIYNINGRLVDTVLNGKKQAGIYNVTWNPVHLSTGVYLCKVESLTASKFLKMFLVK